MFNDVPRTSVARSRFVEWQIANSSPGSASFQLLVTCWFCCYYLRSHVFKSCLSSRFPKTRLKVTWICPSGSLSAAPSSLPMMQMGSELSVQLVQMSLQTGNVLETLTTPLGCRMGSSFVPWQPLCQGIKWELCRVLQQLKYSSLMLK